MPAGRRELRLATSRSRAVLSCLSPEHVPASLSWQVPSPGVPGAGGLLARRGARLRAGAAAAFHVVPPLQPDSCSLFQQVPVISGVIMGVRFGAAKRGFWRGGGGREQQGDSEGPGKDEAGWALVGFRCHFAWDLPCSMLRCRSSPSPHAVGCQLPVSGSAASPSQPYAAPADTRIIHLR